MNCVVCADHHRHTAPLLTTDGKSAKTVFPQKQTPTKWAKPCVRAQNMAIQIRDRHGHKTCAMPYVQCTLYSTHGKRQEAGHKTPENRKFSTQVSWRGPHLALGLHVISKLCHICWRMPPFKTTNYFWKCNTKAVTRMTKLKKLQIVDCWLLTQL